MKTTLLVNGRPVDEVVTRTGFRKTRLEKEKCGSMTVCCS